MVGSRTIGSSSSSDFRMKAEARFIPPPYKCSVIVEKVTEAKAADIPENLFGFII
jgi:hypothetical protein